MSRLYDIADVVVLFSKAFALIATAGFLYHLTELVIINTTIIERSIQMFSQQ